MLVDFSKIQRVVKPESRKHTQKYPLNKKGMTVNRQESAGVGRCSATWLKNDSRVKMGNYNTSGRQTKPEKPDFTTPAQ